MSTVNGAWRGANIIKDGLLLYLDAASPSSYSPFTTINRWKDISTLNSPLSGSLINSPTYSLDSGGSLLFDGIDDYIGLPSPSSRWNWTPSGVGYNTLTFDIWFRSSDSNGFYISKPWNGNGEYNYLITPLTFVLSTGGITSTLYYLPTNTGTWMNLTCIVTPTQFATYQNAGVTNNYINHNLTSNSPLIASNNEDLTIMTLYPYGVPFNLPGFSISGSLSIVKIYNRALSQEEILQNYNATRTRFGV